MCSDNVGPADREEANTDIIVGPSMGIRGGGGTPTPTRIASRNNLAIVSDPGGADTTTVPKPPEPEKSILKLLEVDGEDTEKKLTKYTDKLF